MLTIENHALTIDGQTIPLPHLARPAKVKVWRVPAEYRADGLFVAVTLQGEAEEVPACASADAELVGEATLDPHPDAILAERKAAKKRQIEAERDAACVQPVTALGRTWDADKRSQELLAYAITIAQAGGALPAVWRDHNNENMPVASIADLLAIAGAIAAQTQAAYTASWARKGAVDTATQLVDIDTV